MKHIKICKAMEGMYLLLKEIVTNNSHCAVLVCVILA